MMELTNYANEVFVDTKTYPDVDVVIPTLNASKLLQLCLSSIRGQTYTGKINIIIIDGGSTDETISIAKKYDCDIHVLGSVYSNGLNGARNIALKWCKGQLYWQIDADNVLLDNTVLTKLVEPFLKYRDLQVSLPMLKTDSEQSAIDHWLNDYEIEQINTELKTGLREKNTILVENMNYGLTNASLIRTKMIITVGGYDSDVRVFDRAKKLGLNKTAIVTDAFYYHFQGQTYLAWLKKLGRRIVLFGNMGKSLDRVYFDRSTHNHSYRGQFKELPLLYICFSLLLLRRRKYYFYIGFLLIIGYFLVLLLHPINFVKTYLEFL